MNKAFIVKVPVWEALVVVGCGPTDGRFKRLLSKWLTASEIDGYLKTCNSHGVMGCVHRGEPGCAHALWIPALPNSPENMGYFAHEVAHVAFQMLRNKGVWHTTSSEESYTYLMQYLTKEILTQLKKR